jgi:AraC-like DNA-binding protein
MSARIVEQAGAAAAPGLAGLVGGYHGGRYAGFPPGTHRGMPTSHLDVVISLAEPIHLAAMPDPAQPPGSFAVAVAGLQTGAAVIAHDGSSYSLSLELTPAGARSLLGIPAAALVSTVVSLDDLIGRRAPELVERLASAPDWHHRFAVLDQVLTRWAGERGGPGERGGAGEAAAAVTHAWHRIRACGGAIRVAELAAEVGYSRQHLTKRFVAEFGLTPKQVARLVRFERSRRMLRGLERERRRRPWVGRPRLSEVAARCGYYDQAHLAHEWRDLAGCPPSGWLASEELPFVQAGATEPVTSSMP